MFQTKSLSFVKTLLLPFAKSKSAHARRSCGALPPDASIAYISQSVHRSEKCAGMKKLRLVRPRRLPLAELKSAHARRREIWAFERRAGNSLAEAGELDRR